MHRVVTGVIFPARAHTAFLYLRNGLANCVQIVCGLGLFSYELSTSRGRWGTFAHAYPVRRVSVSQKRHDRSCSNLVSG